MYNFNEDINRRNTNSYKWDSRTDIPEDTIPLWVADMDFRVAQPILDTLRSRVEEGIFGYTYVDDHYYAAIDRWFTKYHDWSILPETVIYTSGVVPALSAIIKALTKPGDKVMVTTPVYNCFFSSIQNNGCTVLESALVLNGDRYEIDFDDFERKASDEKCKLFVLCNPHNPAGRIWSADELRRISEICALHGVKVVSDEIHCELVYNGHRYTPYALVSTVPDWVTCISPSKAFNIAGLQIANIVAPVEATREKINRAININEVCDVNPFGVRALIAAYESPDARQWLDELIPYVYENFRMLKERFNSDIPQMTVIDLEATYLAWIDCRSLGLPSEELEEILIQEAHVWLNAGRMYGTDGEGFMRVNLACPRERLQTALDRLIPVLKALSKDSAQ